MQSLTPNNSQLQRRSAREGGLSVMPGSAIWGDKRLGNGMSRKNVGGGLVPRRFSLRFLLIACACCVLISIFVAVFWDSPLTNSIRIALCHGLPNLSMRSPYTSSLPVLDRVADFTAEHRRPTSWARLTTLVLVAGHAVYTSNRWDTASLKNEANWVLEPFQHGQVSTLLRHIQRGVELAANDSSAVLLFSGGQTRSGAGPRSEALTYWTIAESADWYGLSFSGVNNRSFVEEYARDSFENLLFSICRFHQITGRYPRLIKVVGFEFKRARFVSLHRRALRFPPYRFEYFGIDPDGVNGMRGLAARERSSAMGPFNADPYGCNTASLNNKRERRNPYLRYHPYPQGCPDLLDLFHYCGLSYFRGPLPWDPRVLPQTTH